MQLEDRHSSPYKIAIGIKATWAMASNRMGTTDHSRVKLKQGFYNQK